MDDTELVNLIILVTRKILRYLKYILVITIYTVALSITVTLEITGAI